jgi:aarF domain-containing kinase
MNLVRYNNKALGSPVNRIRVFGECAARVSMNGERWTRRAQLRLQLWFISAAFHFNRWWQAAGHYLLGRRRKGFEDVIDESLAATVEQQMGFQLQLDEPMPS